MSQTNPSHYLTTEQRCYIVCEHDHGTPYDDIKANFKQLFGKKIYNSTIIRVCDKKKETGSVMDKEKTGRPRIYDEREERNIVRNALKLNKTSIRDLTIDPFVNPKGASKTTINTILKTQEIRSLVLPGRIDDLSKQNVKDRKNFAKTYLNWTKADWQQVIFSDESDLLPTYQGKEHVRLRKKQKLVDVVPIREKSKKNVTIKVWGMISRYGAGLIVRYEGTIGGKEYLEMLKEHLLQTYPMLENTAMEEEGLDIERPVFYFMDDNPGAHRAGIVEAWKRQKGIRTLPWPSNSPDINIIENVWGYLEDELYKVKLTLKSPDDTWAKVVELWNTIPFNFIDDLYASLPDRMAKLKLEKGGPIHY